MKKEDQKLRHLEALCLSRKTRNGTSPFSSRIIIRDPDNNWMLILNKCRNRHEKSYGDSEEKFYKNRIYKMDSNITRKRRNFFFSTNEVPPIFWLFLRIYLTKVSRRLVTFNWTNSIRIFAPFTRHTTNSFPRRGFLCARAIYIEIAEQGPSTSVVSDTNGRQRPQVYKGVRRPALVSSLRRGI